METNRVYCEIYNSEEEDWDLYLMPADLAFSIQLVLGGEFFHYVDESAIEFVEE